MFTFSTYPDLKRHVIDSGFTVAKLETLDGAVFTQLEAENPQQLADLLESNLNHYRGVFTLRFRRHKTDNVPWAAQWQPNQQPNGTGSVLNGPVDEAGIEARVMARLKAEAAREAEREELERLRSINGQFSAALGTILQGVLPQILNRFAPAAATLQGVDLETLPEIDHNKAREALEVLLQFATPDFLKHLAAYVAAHPDSVGMIATLTGYQEKPIP